MAGELLTIIVPALILLIVSGVGGYVANFFRTKKAEILNNSGDIIDIKRVLVMLAKKMDRGNKRLHPDVESNFEELVKDLLTDDITDKE